MNTGEFSKMVRKSIIEDNLTMYKEIFTSTKPDEATDPYWKKALEMYSNLNDSQRIVLFEIMRQTMVDTVSTVFGTIDGVCTLEGADDGLKLLTENGGEVLSGGLQDIFLEQEENKA